MLALSPYGEASQELVEVCQDGWDVGLVEPELEGQAVSQTGPIHSRAIHGKVTTPIADDPEVEPLLHRVKGGFTGQGLVEPTELLAEVCELVGAELGMVVASKRAYDDPHVGANPIAVPVVMDVRVLVCSRLYEHVCRRKRTEEQTRRSFHARSVPRARAAGGIELTRNGPLEVV